MRTLMWFSLGFGGSCCLWAYGFPMAWTLPACIFCVLGFLLTLLLRKKTELRAMRILFIGIFCGSIWFGMYRQTYLLPAVSLEGTERQLAVCATGYGEATDYGISVDGITEHGGKTYRIRVFLDSPQDVRPGERIAGTFRVRLTIPDGADAAAYHRGNGLFLLAYEEKDVFVAPGKPDWRCYGALLAERIGRILEAYFPQDTAPFAKALLLGDTSGLTYAQDTALKLSGIRHVVAVSGLHVSILFAMVSTVTMKRPWLRALVGLPLLALFAAMAGFSPSVSRACLMCGLMIFSMLLRRDYDGPTALAFSCTVMLLMNPLTVVSAAFQLSVGCVAGIYLFQDKIQYFLLSRIGPAKGKNPLAKWKRWFVSCTSVSLSAMTFSLPLSALYFGAVSLVSILTNLVTLWVVTAVFCGIVAVCLLGLFWKGAAVFLAKVCSMGIHYILFAAELLGGFPVAAVYTRSVYIGVWLVFCYVLLMIFLRQKERKPKVLLCCMALGLCCAVCASWLEPRTDDIRMTVLDVGHGQSILLQCGDRAFLVDCGGDWDENTADMVAETMLSQGVRHLDAMVLTHMDRDHMGAAENLLTRVGTDRLILPYSRNTVVTGAQLLMPMEQVYIQLDGGKITVFGPVSTRGGNENSLCVLFESENCAILITGDRSGFGERMLLRQTELPKVDVLIAGHHGADSSTCSELLEAVSPQIVILSTADNGSFQGPGDQLLRRLEEYGCRVYRTDRLGTILYRR